MVTLKEVFLSIFTTKNFWDGLMLAYSKRPAHIALRTGEEFDLSWEEYRRIIYLVFHGYTVLTKEGAFYCKRGDTIVVGSKKILPVLCGYLDKYNVFDFNNKVVLDIGGFMGETAVMFTKWGAKKIVIYEPVVENHTFIRKNVETNRIDAEIHVEGIGEADGSVTVAYEEVNQMFGLSRSGNNTKTIKIRSAAKVIEESGADIAKINCEGCETVLLSVRNEILRKIPNYIIETHTQGIRNSLLRKFASAGFKASHETQIVPNQVSIIAFEKCL